MQKWFNVQCKSTLLRCLFYETLCFDQEVDHVAHVWRDLMLTTVGAHKLQDWPVLGIQ